MCVETIYLQNNFVEWDLVWKINKFVSHALKFFIYKVSCTFVFVSCLHCLKKNKYKYLNYLK